MDSSLFDQVLVSHAGGLVLLASSFVPDGANVASFRDSLDASHLFTQALPAAQVPIPVGHADFNMALCATFVSANVNRYTSNRPPASWAYLTGGAGVEISGAFTQVSIATSLRTIFATNNSGAGAGIAWLVTQTTGASQIIMRKSGGGGILNFTTLAAFAVNVPYVFQIRHATAETPDVTAKRTGAAAGSTDYLSAAAADLPQGSLTIGALPNTVLPTDMRWHSLLIAPKILSAAERATRDAWFVQETGLVP